jgi:cytochrome c
MSAARWLLCAALPCAAAASAAPDKLPGELVYARCAACHALAYDRVGPRHCGLLGRRAGTVAGFAYSPAMKNSGLTWDEKTLDRFLAQPMKALPGTTMTYDGVPDPKERRDLIAYLHQASHAAECNTAGASARGAPGGAAP